MSSYFNDPKYFSQIAIECRSYLSVNAISSTVEVPVLVFHASQSDFLLINDFNHAKELTLRIAILPCIFPRQKFVFFLSWDGFNA